MARPRSAPRDQAQPSRPATHGAHYLLPWAVSRLLAAVSIVPGDLVVDLGAGIGALTRPLAERGAQVIAVEQHPPAAAALRRRLRDRDVTVVETDIRDFRWPKRWFRIVANPPFGLSIWLLHELTRHAPATLSQAHLLLQRGFVRQLTEGATDARTARWQQSAELTELLRLPAAAFAPAPRVGASLLQLRLRRGATRGRH